MYSMLMLFTRLDALCTFGVEKVRAQGSTSAKREWLTSISDGRRAEERAYLAPSFRVEREFNKHRRPKFSAMMRFVGV